MARHLIPQKPATPTTAMNAEAMAQDSEAGQSLAVISSNINDAAVDLGALIGRNQALEMMTSFTKALSLSELQKVKDTKQYRQFKGLRTGSIELDGTWEGFCTAIGTSRSKVDEDLLALQAFGESAYNKLKALGASYSDLRQLRALPDAERRAVDSKLFDLDNKDAVRELIDDLVIARVGSDKQLLDAKALLEARDSVVETKQGRIDELEAKLKFKPKKDLPARNLHESLAYAELAEVTCALDAYMTRLAGVMADIMGADDGTEAMQDQARAGLAFVAQRVTAHLREYGMDDLAEFEVVPLWLKDGVAELATGSSQG